MTESEVRAALEAFERAISADPRLAKLCGYLCPACGRLAAERDASAHNEREARKHLACRIEAADRAYAEVERLTVEPTRDLTIAHCSACPFATRADPDYPACKANLHLDPENRVWYRLFETSVDGDWVFPAPPPDWCPLRAGAVRIRVDASEDQP